MNKTTVTLIIMSLCMLHANVHFGQINEDLKLAASDAAADDEFGRSVAISQGLVAVGVPLDDDNGLNSGSAYLFDASTGLELMKLLPSDGQASAEFGYSIAIDNDIIAVGARGDNENGTMAGAAYLFDASTGLELMKLLPSDGAAGDEFGNSISIDNGVVAVGAWRADEFGDASGAAYLFDASTGNQIIKLLPDTGNNYQTFGVSIAVDSGIVAVGARTFFVLGEGYTFAKAYLFDVAGNQFNVLQPDILNLNGDLGGHFADCIDIDNGLVAVGAPFRSVILDHSGAAYVFDASTGSQISYIVPDDGQDRDNFGISISIDNQIVAVGSHQDDDNGFNSGSAYIYDLSSGIELEKLLASDGASFDLLGSSVAIADGTVVVGAKDDDDSGSSSGSVYMYHSGSMPCMNAPENLQHTILLSGDVELKWDSDTSFVACQVKGKPLSEFTFVSSPPIYGIGPDSYIIDSSFLDPGVSYNWKVHCACTISPLVKTPFSLLDTFTVPLLFSVQDISKPSASVSPNPVNSQSKLELRGYLGFIDLTITNMAGISIYYDQVFIENKVATIDLPFNKLKSGQYILNVSNGQVSSQIKFNVTKD